MSRHSSRPSSDAPALRVLQLIGDTDASPEHVDALELHRALSGLGLEVRTLALGPGSAGGLDQVVPVISPGRHSFAARTQLAVEARWADVLCLHGPTVLTPAALRRAGTAPAVVLAVASSTLARRARRLSADGAIARRASVVVVDSARDAATVVSRYGCDRDRIRVLERSADARGSAWVQVLLQAAADEVQR